MAVTLTKVMYSVVTHTPGFLPESDPYTTSDAEDAYYEFRGNLVMLLETFGPCECGEPDMTEMCDECREEAHIRAYLADLRFLDIQVKTDILRNRDRKGHKVQAETIASYTTDAAFRPYLRVALEATI